MNPKVAEELRHNLVNFFLARLEEPTQQRLELIHQHCLGGKTTPLPDERHCPLRKIYDEEDLKSFWNRAQKAFLKSTRSF